MATIGPLLRHVLERLDRVPQALRNAEYLALAAHIGGAGEGESDPRLPLVLQVSPDPAVQGESWHEYKARIEPRLLKVSDILTGGTATPLYAANGLSAKMPISQLQELARTDHVPLAMFELDPRVFPALMDDVPSDLSMSTFYGNRGPLRGRGVRVAVLDSGIDTLHPHLRVSASVETCGEGWDIPGDHGTHCAGSIASQDTVFSGVAPDVELLNIKVLRSNGSGTHTDIAKGIDRALDLAADILSMSLGFNHLPAWSDKGHGWACGQGTCPLCMAVNNAAALGATVVAAAGNEHARAETLRQSGFGGSFDTELACPGQADGAITVGAITKSTFLPSSFSSHGPTSFNGAKPDLSGPGVNIMSTVRVPRMANGLPVMNPPRRDLFARFSGTSMATPIVAGAVALVIGLLRLEGRPTDPTAVRQYLLQNCVSSVPHSHMVVGRGRLDMSRA